METVQIDKDTLRELIIDHLALTALYAGGIDNWDLYDKALTNFRSMPSEEIDSIVDDYIINNGKSKVTK